MTHVYLGKRNGDMDVWQLQFNGISDQNLQSVIDAALSSRDNTARDVEEQEIRIASILILDLLDSNPSHLHYIRILRVDHLWTNRDCGLSWLGFLAGSLPLAELRRALIIEALDVCHNQKRPHIPYSSRPASLPHKDSIADLNPLQERSDDYWKGR